VRFPKLDGHVRARSRGLWTGRKVLAAQGRGHVTAARAGRLSHPMLYIQLQLMPRDRRSLGGDSVVGRAEKPGSVTGLHLYPQGTLRQRSVTNCLSDVGVSHTVYRPIEFCSAGNVCFCLRDKLTSRWTWEGRRGHGN
jgi:hypothetical protein